MKARLIFIFFLLLGLQGVSAKQNLEAYFSYATFYTPTDGPYIETYLSIVGTSIQHKQNESGNYQGQVEVLYIFYQEDEVKNFKKFNLMSPELADTGQGYPNFLDQQRILIPNGTYMLEIQLTDLNSEEKKPVSSLQEIEIDYQEDKVELSQVEFVESFSNSENEEGSMLSKSGYDLVPYVSDFFPGNLNKLRFYAEVYNTKKFLGENDMYLLRYFIEKYENGKVLSSFLGFTRQTAAPVNVLLKEFNIEKLPSGNYNLVIEVRNRENEVLATRKTFFQRSNPNIKLSAEDFAGVDLYSTFVDKMNSRDSLEFFIRSLRPISDPLERNFADNTLETAELEMLKKYFFSFWYKRNELTPEREWLQYFEKVKLVDREYGIQTMEGFETDRGRVYLQYGPPNQIVRRYNEPSSYPYEIWQYYKTDIRADAKFVFYNPNLGSNNFELLHSNVYGEIRDFRWKVRLQKRNDQNPNLDNDNSFDHFGGEIDNFFENPR